jgi:hypothetical protein
MARPIEIPAEQRIEKPRPPEPKPEMRDAEYIGKEHPEYGKWTPHGWERKTFLGRDHPVFGKWNGHGWHRDS